MLARTKALGASLFATLLLCVGVMAPSAAAQNQDGLVNVMIGDVSILNDANIGVAAQVAANINLLISHAERSHAVSLMRVGHRQCRFILNESPARPICCGAPAADGSWCPAHRRLVYMQPQRTV